MISNYCLLPKSTVRRFLSLLCDRSTALAEQRSNSSAPLDSNFLSHDWLSQRPSYRKQIVAKSGLTLLNHSKYLIALISLVYTPWSCAAEHQTTETGSKQTQLVNPAKYDFSDWKAFFQEKIPNDGAGGYAWVGMENGIIVAKGSGGYARAPWEINHPALPMTTTRPVWLASVSKLLTHVGLAKLWELKRGTRQKFDYNQSAAPFLTTLVPKIDPSFKAVTLRHLLDHTSGLTSDFWDLQGLQRELSKPLTHTPGSHYQYLNANYILLAAIMTQISGQPYSEFMLSHVFLPLNMNQTSDHAADKAPALIYGPASLRKPGVLMPSIGILNAGAFGWWSTAEDLAKLMYALRFNTLLDPATSSLEGFNQGSWASDGKWTWSWGDSQGSLSARVYRYSDTLDGILLINSDKGPASTLLNEAFELGDPSPYPEIKIIHPIGNSLVDGIAKIGFGRVLVGQMGSSKTFVIRNTGTAPLKGIAITKTGLNKNDFKVTDPSALALAPGASTSFKITFLPTSTGTREAAIQIKSNDSDESPFDIKFTGTGTQLNSIRLFIR